MSFTHLHVSTAFSAHHGVDRPEILAAAAAGDGAWALACTDRDGLYGAVKHVGACLRAGLTPILGVDLAVLPRDASRGRVVVLARGAAQHGGLGTRFLPRTGGRPAPLPALAGKGYAALCSLTSAAHSGGFPADMGLSPERDLPPETRHTTKRRNAAALRAVDAPVGVTVRQLAEHSRHGATPVLTVLLGPLSDVGRAAVRRDYRAARSALLRWKQALGPGALAVEIVCHLATPGGPYSVAHAVRMLRIARELGVPAVLTNAVRYVEPDGAATADVLDAVRVLGPLNTDPSAAKPGAAHAEGTQVNGQGWLKPARDMRALAVELTRELGNPAAAGELLRDTEELAESCALDPRTDLGWGVNAIPEHRVLGLNGDPQALLRARCEAALPRCFGPDAARSEFGSGGRGSETVRLDHELAIIEERGLASYFHTVATATDLIRDLGVRTAARGSGVSSLVAFLMGISHVNPLAHDLVFERFLSARRTTLPDIDVDVESAQRHRVYRELFRRFGSERTTLMSMQNAYRARGAVRDVGMALGMGEEDVDSVAKSLWRFSASSFREALDTMPELRPLAERLEADRAAGGHQVDLLVDLTERLDRLPRHISMHPCGVILSDASLLSRTPVEPSGLGLPMSQFDKHDMDPMGLIKLDVLGVRMQSTIAYTLDEIARIGGGGPIDLARVPLDDEPTFDMIRTTNTLGIFQIESPGQRELIGKLAPTQFNDLIIDISLFRPGPMQSDMVRPFLEQRHGFAKEDYPHPDLEPILAETHGVVVYHEQVLRIIDLMTGCGLDEADVRRRRLGRPELLPELERHFRENALRNGYPIDLVDRVWNTVAAFGAFGFCKAHGVAFAVPTYHSAWLKAHHPEAFLAGLMEHDPGMYPRRLLVSEARRLGVPLLPLDVNDSGLHFRVERMLDPSGTPVEGIEAVPGTRASGRFGVRLAWSLISSLSEAEAVRLEANAPYDSVADVRERARPTRANLRRLAQLGALDRFLVPGAGGREDLVHHLDAQREATVRGSGAGRAAGASTVRVPRRAQVNGQMALPLGMDLETSALPPLFPALTPAQRIGEELDLTATDLSGHLMSAHHGYLSAIGATSSDRLLSLHSGSRVLVAGVRVATQTPPMRSGERVVFLSLDDGHGCSDIAFFTRAQHGTGPLLFSASLMLVEGVTRRTGPRAVSVQALRAWDLKGPSTELPGPGYLAETEGSWRAELSREPVASVPHEGGGWYGSLLRAGTRGVMATELAPAGALAPVPWRPGDGSDATGGNRDEEAAIG